MTLDDCVGGPGETTDEVSLALLSGGEDVTKTVYTEAASSSSGGRVSVWRRTCSAATGDSTEWTEVFEGVRPGTTSATCADPIEGSACPQVRFTTWPLDSVDPLVISATRRADSASLRFDATGNRLPVARITLLSQTVGQPFDVEVSASSSLDPDGEITAYRWVFPTRPDGAPGGPAPVVVEGGPELADTVQRPQFPVVGTYSITLTVTDSTGATATAYKRITASPRAPSAVATITPVAPVAGAEISFVGSASTDPDGTVVAHRWVLGDEENSAGIRYVVDQADWSLTFPAYVVGRIPVTLTVTDDQGRTDTLVTSINIRPADVGDPVPEPGVESPPVTVPGGPVASFAATQGGGGADWTFDASASTDDGSIVSYTWDPGVPTGVSLAGVSTAYQYPAPGEYTVRLTVVDDTGLSGTSTKVISVPGAPSPPQAPQQSGFDLAWAPVPGLDATWWTSSSSPMAVHGH